SGQIQRRNMQLGIHGSKGRIAAVEWTCISVELEVATAGKTRGNSDGEFGIQGKIGSSHIHVIVSSTLLRIGAPQDDLAVLKLQFFDGNVRRRTTRRLGRSFFRFWLGCARRGRGSRVPAAGISDRGEIPVTC